MQKIFAFIGPSLFNISQSYSNYHSIYFYFLFWTFFFIKRFSFRLLAIKIRACNLEYLNWFRFFAFYILHGNLYCFILTSTKAVASRFFFPHRSFTSSIDVFEAQKWIRIITYASKVNLFYTIACLLILEFYKQLTMPCFCVEQVNLCSIIVQTN